MYILADFHTQQYDPITENAIFILKKRARLLKIVMGVPKLLFGNNCNVNCIFDIQWKVTAQQLKIYYLLYRSYRISLKVQLFLGHIFHQ